MLARTYKDFTKRSPSVGRVAPRRSLLKRRVLPLASFAAVAHCLLTSASAADDTDHLTQHFILAHGPGSEFVSWRSAEVRYTISGDLAKSVGDQIESYLRRVSDRTGIKFVYANSSSLYMIYEDQIFNQIRNEPDRLASVGFPKNIIDEVARDFASKPNMKCMSQRSVDSDNYIVSALVFSDSNSSECVKPIINDIIGLRGVDKDDDAVFYACILYKARIAGFRTKQQIEQNINIIKEHCTSVRIQRND